MKILTQQRMYFQRSFFLGTYFEKHNTVSTSLCSFLFSAFSSSSTFSAFSAAVLYLSTCPSRRLICVNTRTQSSGAGTRSHQFFCSQDGNTTSRQIPSNLMLASPFRVSQRSSQNPAAIYKPSTVAPGEDELCSHHRASFPCSVL